MKDALTNQILNENSMPMILVAILIIMAVVAFIIISRFKKKKSHPLQAPPPPQPSLPEVLQPVSVPAAVSKPMPAPAPPPEPNLKSALKKTHDLFFGRLRDAFSNPDKKAVLEQVEEILYTSDLGPTTVQKLMSVVESELGSSELAQIDKVKAALRNEMLEILKPVQNPLAVPAEPIKSIESSNENEIIIDQVFNRAKTGPTVLMVVGVNGAGKTTTIGKLSARLAIQNLKVLVAAGDTFRAAAGGQLKTWTDRASAASAASTISATSAMSASELGNAAAESRVSRGQIDIYWPENTTDPSAVAFDALTKAKSQDFDFVILDTAGRLHTQSHLMEELKKVKRIMAKVIPEAPHETWIVLDANSGQNALLQAKEFHQALNLTGVVLTKMDGTAKGGVALGVVDQLKLPLKLVGIGEKINHLKTFNYVEYVDSILG